MLHPKTSHLAPGYWLQVTVTFPKTQCSSVSLTLALAVLAGLSQCMPVIGISLDLTTDFSVMSWRSSPYMQPSFSRTQHIIFQLLVLPFMVAIFSRR